jgi:hypothetical protein
MNSPNKLKIRDELVEKGHMSEQLVDHLLETGRQLRYKNWSMAWRVLDYLMKMKDRRATRGELYSAERINFRRNYVNMIHDLKMMDYYGSTTWYTFGGNKTRDDLVRELGEAKKEKKPFYGQAASNLAHSRTMAYMLLEGTIEKVRWGVYQLTEYGEYIWRKNK